MTIIQHHPADDLLLALAAGSLAAGPSLVVASHVEACAQCRGRMQVLENAGGVLQAASREGPATCLPAAPDGMSWPRALQQCSATRWHWLAPGMRWSRVTLPADPQAKLFLLRIGAGMKLAWHTHSENELTQVLHGSFHDGRALFGPGDFDQADGDIHHQPVVQASSECICLASIEGKMLFDGAVARALGALIGM
jgi:putative transcriptional regulator